MPNNPDDKAFHELIDGVIPLKKSNKQTDKPSKASAPKKHQTPELSPVLTDTDYHPYGSDDLVSFKRETITPSQWHVLEHGKMTIDARLDLHGQTSEQARESLSAFIKQAQRLHCRCIHIIHGKSEREGANPRLKNHCAYWLRQMPCVLAFISAPKKNGGRGALYVLLRQD